MRFKALPVTSFEDVTLDFEQLSLLAILDKTPTNFLQLLSAQKLQLALGNVTMTWPGASATSGTVVVTHNIGRVPQVVVSARTSNNGFACYAALTANPTTTQFTVYANATAGSPIAGDVTAVWYLAIG